jgi:hypothetical protein
MAGRQGPGWVIAIDAAGLTSPCPLPLKAMDVFRCREMTRRANRVLRHKYGRYSITSSSEARELLAQAFGRQAPGASTIGRSSAPFHRRTKPQSCLARSSDLHSSRR